jgi:ADP-ribose pyrophosphatase YjhB (NUDIX family)
MSKAPQYRRTITSGTIVFKDIDGTLKIALARDPEKGEDKWVLPKGHVREGESLEATAIRETCEEVGVTKMQLICYLGCVTRLSVENWGETVEKDIHFYLAYALSSSNIKPADFETVVESSWFTITEAIARIPWQEEQDFLQKHFALLTKKPN